MREFALPVRAAIGLYFAHYNFVTGHGKLKAALVVAVGISDCPSTMYCYRLWIELNESTEEADCGQLDAKASELQVLVNAKLTCIRMPRDCVFQVNYAKIFQCSAGANHRGTNHDALLDVLRFVIEKLPGSLGLVYWSDDEQPEDEYSAGHNVIVVAGGKLQERSDPFFASKEPTARKVTNTSSALPCAKRQH